MDRAGLAARAPGSKIEIGAAAEDASVPVWPLITGKFVNCTRSTNPPDAAPADDGGVDTLTAKSGGPTTGTGKRSVP